MGVKGAVWWSLRVLAGGAGQSQIIDLKTSVTGKSIDHYNDLSARRLVASPVSHIDLLVTVSSKLPSGSTTLILVHTMEEGGFPSLGKKCRDPKMIGMWKMGREIGRGASGRSWLTACTYRISDISYQVALESLGIRKQANTQP